MGIMKRVQRILSANINKMLDDAENPALVLKQLVRDMEDAVREAQQNRVKATAELKRLEKEKEQVAAEGEEWGDRARQALRRSDEDLARQALTRQAEVEKSLGNMEEQRQRHQETVEAMARSVEQLKVRLEDARMRSRTLSSQVGAATSAARASVDVTPFEDFERIAQQLDTESELLATAAELEVDELDQAFSEAEADADIEARLAELRADIAGDGS